jgi:anthranilate synthase component 1
VPETYRFKLDSTPDLTEIVAAMPLQYPFLLDSAATGPLGNFSLLLRAGSECLELSSDGVLSGPGKGSGFLDRLKYWCKTESENSEPDDTDLPFYGGWFVFLSYELAGEIEPSLHLPPAPGPMPVALAVRCEGAVIVQHGEYDAAYLVAESPGLLQQMRREICEYSPALRANRMSEIHAVPESDEKFINGVERIKTYLEEGDVFQVNLSRRWEAGVESGTDAMVLYRRLRQENPAPFAGLMLWKDSALMSSSPERLVEVRGRLVQTRPIAGTYPRGHDVESDLALSQDMLAHPKEQAEHIMLIDLERNDLGRVCESGSVEVSELMTLESYTHVHHIVSNVKGRLRHEVSSPEVIRAVFPGGTITGCPKVRCMEIIAELEETGRGFYTGSMGYISKDGQMDLNILIRSMLLENETVSLRTGAGIVADSVPQRELLETVAKAKGVLKALESQDV